MPTSHARPAATVVVLRPSPPAFEILMVRRHESMAFMPGAYVFPGGRVDETDRPPSDLVPPAASSRFPDLTPEAELRHRLAAVRELAEEAALRIAPEDLVPCAHWVTPEPEPRRYDTRFFVAQLSDAQRAHHDGLETTTLEWLTPEDAIDRGWRTEISLPPPTWTTLRQLARFRAVQEVLEWAERTPIVRIQPAIHRGDATVLLTLPGDPWHPPIPGWEVPEETRFVLDERLGWRPIRT